MSIAGHVSGAMLPHYPHVRMEARRRTVSSGKPNESHNPSQADSSKRRSRQQQHPQLSAKTRAHPVAFSWNRKKQPNSCAPSPFRFHANLPIVQILNNPARIIEPQPKSSGASREIPLE